MTKPLYLELASGEGFRRKGFYLWIFWDRGVVRCQNVATLAAEICQPINKKDCVSSQDFEETTIPNLIAGPLMLRALKTHNRLKMWMERGGGVNESGIIKEESTPTKDYKFGTPAPSAK